MIKCDYFGKFLKQGFFTLLISCFILLGGFFVNAGFSQPIGIVGYSSIYDNNYELTFLTKGGVKTLFLGQGKSVLAFNNGAFFWWATNGLPYYYDHSYQGFFGEYRLCDGFTGLVSGVSNCSSYPMTGDFKQVFVSFFSSIKQGDYAYYNYEQADVGSSYYDNTIAVCFSSSEFNRSLCFRQHECYNGRGCSAGNYGSLVNSQNLSNLTYGLINSNWIGPAPGQNGYDGSFEGSSDGSFDVGNNPIVITGDYVYRSCTYGEILNRLESDGFSNYLCYGGLDNFDLFDSSVNYNVVPGTGKTLSQILSYSQSWDTPQEWFDFWNGLYQDKNSPSYLSMRSSYPAVYRTWFDLYYQYGGSLKNFDYVREYCAMKSLNVDSSTVYHGKYFEGVCDTINDELQYGYGIFGSSGEVIVGTNRNGVGNFSGKVQSNAVEFIQDFFNKAKSVISTDFPDIGIGFLPTYIILFLCAIILFRFISH